MDFKIPKEYIDLKARARKIVDEEAMCKILGTELGLRVTDKVMMIYGGLGVSRGLPRKDIP